MVQATQFLLRWLFLNNLIHERAELQSLPQIHPQPEWFPPSSPSEYGHGQGGYGHGPHGHGHGSQGHGHEYNPLSQGHHPEGYVHGHGYEHEHEHEQPHSDAHIQSQHPPPYPNSHAHPHPHPQYPQSAQPPMRRVQQLQSQSHSPSQSQIQSKSQSKGETLEFNEREWKRKALYAIRLYPPGSSLRLLALDSLRLEIVHELARELHLADETLEEYSIAERNKNRNRGRLTVNDNDENEIDNDNDTSSEFQLSRDQQLQQQYNKHHRNRNGVLVDDTIVKEFQKATSIDMRRYMGESENENDANADDEDNSSDDDYSDDSTSEDEHETLSSMSTPHLVTDGGEGTSDDDDVIDLDQNDDDDENSRTRLGDKSRPTIPQQRIPKQSTILKSITKSSSTTSSTLDPKVQSAIALHRETREYLPQLLSAVLHSPAPLTQSTTYTSNLNPLSTLRQLLITRCTRDPNLGIEMCWLLEAEVGRTWKRLFEHRQMTGRRLIVVLPADKAAVIRQIGSEKRSAFDLLQDVEGATAYGVCSEEGNVGGGEDGQGQGHGHSHQTMGVNMDTDMDAYGHAQHNGDEQQREEVRGLYHTPRLPAHLSLKRCSHFGDTMHFIDRLTQISLDLRRVSVHQRENFLQERLEELNRRLRRRMISKGHVSLDVEDGRGPYDWPTLSDISPDSLKHSIHFPLEPTATIWPGAHGEDPSLQQIHSHSPLFELKTKQGLMKVLNIVSNKSRILASRERCPYLVHCEVLETGLGGRDARLYATDSGDAGVTLNEAMGMASGRKRRASSKDKGGKNVGGFPPYRIPGELSPPSDYINNLETTPSSSHSEELYLSQQNREMATLMPRGGSDQGGYFHSTMDESGYFPSPYDVAREQQLQQLHEHLQENQQYPNYGPPQPPMGPLQPQPSNVPMLTSYSSLLDRVFGIPWADTCEKVRQTSPYGGVKGWKLASFIMKAGEDIRREALVMQVISKMKSWFDNEIPMEYRPHLKPYTIMCVGADAGLLECLQDAKSVDEVKKSTDGFTTLREYFERAYGKPRPRVVGQYPQQPQHHQHFGPHGNPINPQPEPHFQQRPPEQLGGRITFEKAQDNFLRSLVGYSLVCYILQIKDRHNANILLDREGHIMHIDFGFVLGDTPKMGKVPLFSERAPFKLTAEFWEVIGGWNFNEGGLGVRFCKMFEEAFACASSHRDELVSLIEAAVLNLSRDPRVARLLADGVRERLRMRGPRGSNQQKTFIMDLVNTALTSWGTSTYDWLQKSMNGYI